MRGIIKRAIEAVKDNNNLQELFQIWLDFEKMFGRIEDVESVEMKF